MTETIKAKHCKKFLWLCETQLPKPAKTLDTVVNLSNTVLDNSTLSVLFKGLNFTIAPTSVPIKEILIGVQKAARTLPIEVAEEIRHETARIIMNASKPKDNLTTTERRALTALHRDSELTILSADKGNATVILNTVDYIKKIHMLLEDLAYKKFTKDPTNTVECKTGLLLKKSTIPDEIHTRLRPTGTCPPRLYGLPKIHKRVPLRPIVSNIGAPTYQLSNTWQI